MRAGIVYFEIISHLNGQIKGSKRRGNIQVMNLNLI
jgi:hypothetical protein